MILIKAKASPVHTQLIQLLFTSLLVLFKMPMPCAEKTLCERRLAALPPAPGLFYYQRIELNSAALCAERCVDDWEFCRSAVLIEDIRNKSLCQLYSGSFESRIPLNLPAFAPLQTDPNHLLPITLVELTDAPCSSKFARQSTIFDQISANAREQLRMIPGPAVRNRLDIAAAVHNSEKATKNDNELVDQHEQVNTAGDATERTEKASAVDQTYLVPFSSASSSSVASESPHQLASLSSSSSSNGYSVPIGHHQPAPLQFPPNGLPIQPVFVSRGNNQYQQQHQQQYNFGCPNGICSRIGAQLNTFNNHNDDDTVTQPPCAARKSSDPCAPRIGESIDREKNNNLWTEWTEWTQCSRSCGGGEQMKRRSCKSGVDDQCMGSSFESRPCNDEQCPTWSNWGSWTECSATCGTGTQRRVRECESPRHNANAAICPIGTGVEHRECELRSCPEWSQWEPWSACSKSCGAGESVRRRQCRNAASKDECQGADVERLLCNTQLCPAWSTWTEWSPCSKSCGTGGTQTRKRECRYAGVLSDECTGAAKDEKQCKQLEACPSWAEWGEWSDCTANCGHGQQSRVRKCLGHGCAGNEKEVRSCQKATCPYFEQWSEWGGCSVTCGRGFCERRRKCIKFNDDDDGPHRDNNKKLVPFEGMMPVREEMVDGTKREKGGGPEDITSVDTIRPRTLEVIQSSAVQRRSPLISTKLALLNEEEDGFVVDQSETAPPKLYDTKIVPISAGDCVGPSVERKTCDAGPCCKWTQWSSWSDCVVQCGSTGYRDRTRRCELTQTETETKMDDGLAGTTVQQQFVSSRNFAFGTGGALRCAITICRGESTQTESCAIPTPKTICGRDQPMFDQRLPKVPILRAKMKPDLSLLREGIGIKENDDDSSYITAPKFGRRAVDIKKLASEEDAGNFNEQHEHNIDDADDDLIETETIKWSSSSANEAEENGAVTATTVDDQQQQHNCTWTEWSAWSECGGVECSKRRSRTCISSPIADQNNKCHCAGHHVQQTKCPPDECQQQNSDEMAGKAASSSPGITTIKMKKDENKSASPSSFIKRLHLIPRHKASEVEKRREAERRTNRHQNNAQNNDFPSAVHEAEAPPPLTDQPNDSAKLIRISGLRIGSSGDQENEQQEQEVPSSPTATAECAVDDWLPWSEWSACDGLCASSGGTRGRPPAAEGQRTRHRRCACERGCAGIAEESISCALTNCP
ncbi:hypothetical protein niasHS_008662 [Heterodera schachtii]|uniref:Apple domain-containing protein n=1 Tax=Heterodera schachtii TaxID=97005 RepID=A0ABD2JAW0_HETSC